MSVPTTLLYYGQRYVLAAEDPANPWTSKTGGKAIYGDKAWIKLSRKGGYPQIIQPGYFFHRTSVRNLVSIAQRGLRPMVGGANWFGNIPMIYAGKTINDTVGPRDNVLLRIKVVREQKWKRLGHDPKADRTWVTRRLVPTKLLDVFTDHGWEPL